MLSSEQAWSGVQMCTGQRQAGILEISKQKGRLHPQSEL